MHELEPNPSGCAGFESNVFRRERCKHCSHAWRLHRGVISEAAVVAFTGVQQQQASARNAAVAEAQAAGRARARARKRNQRAVEDGWFFDGGGMVEEVSGTSDEGAESDHSEQFRMFSGRDLERAPGNRMGSLSSGSTFVRQPKIVNLIDFSECDVPSDSFAQPTAIPPLPGTAAAAAAAEADPPHRPNVPAAAAAAAAARVEAPRTPAARSPSPQRHAFEATRPLHPPLRTAVSLDANQFRRIGQDELLEEIQYLRQMLADANQETMIVREMLEEKDRLLEALTQQGAKTDAKLRRKLTERDEGIQQLHADLQKGQEELRRLRVRLAFFEGCEETARSISSEADLAKWECELREATQRSLSRLEDRRVELRVAAAIAAAEAANLCKICYDQIAACALLPCRHHSFCGPCGRRVEQSPEAACPLCRTPVTGLFETFCG